MLAVPKVLTGHLTVRSVWFRNSVRGALGLAIAVTIAETVLVVVLFNIISPIGWQVGLVRVEDVLFGCASALISGMLLWPRGAAAAIRNALAEYYRRSADAVVAATDHVVGTAGGGEHPIGQAMSYAAIASLRLDDALREYLFERGTRNVPLEALTALANGAGRIRLIAEAVAELTPVADPGQSTACALTGTAGAARDWFEHQADRLEPHRPDAPTLPAPAVAIAEMTVLADARDFWADHPAAAVRPGLLADGRTLWMAALYLDNLCWLQRRLVAPSDELDGRARAAPWSDLPARSDAHR